MIARQRGQSAASAVYTPTRTDIHRACLEIQRTWSRSTRARRRVDRRGARWALPMLLLTELVQFVNEEPADDLR